MITTSFYDPSARESKRHDYKAIVLGSLLPSGIYYVRYAFIRHATTDTVLEKAYDLDQEYADLLFGFEDNGFQVLYEKLFEYKRQEKGYALTIQRMTSTGNKNARIEGMSGLIERGILRFRQEGGRWYSDIGLLLEQLLAFPHGDHDDGPDALYYAFQMAKGKAMRPAYGTARKQEAPRRSDRHPQRRNVERQRRMSDAIRSR